uniref:MarR family transcriptional regulator n=1 Tax=Thermosporothrix sp. COM3 TaxID=2490863 RepID=A0A455SJX5_9CHLR|nr:MarR family transcriptional regulator [Thermosporothrix sp. COM3]
MATDQLIDSVMALYHLIRKTSHPVSRAEMTPEQYWLLRHLSHKGAVSIGELAEALGVTGSSVTTACKRLEKAGLVLRQRQSTDERMVHVVLTEEGRKQVETWKQRKRELLQDLLSPLDSEQQDTLQHLLTQVLKRAEESGYPVQLKGSDACNTDKA